jgi:hypothetical protein
MVPHTKPSFETQVVVEMSPAQSVHSSRGSKQSSRLFLNSLVNQLVIARGRSLAGQPSLAREEGNVLYHRRVFPFSWLSTHKAVTPETPSSTGLP